MLMEYASACSKGAPTGEANIIFFHGGGIVAEQLVFRGGEGNNQKTCLQFHG